MHAVLLAAVVHAIDHQFWGPGGIFKDGAEAVNGPFIARFFFEGLPSGIATTKTDADGKFTMRVPRTGTFGLVAHGSRLAGTQEEYYWFVWTSLDGNRSKRVMLTNSNRVGQHTSDIVFK